MLARFIQFYLIAFAALASLGARAQLALGAPPLSPTATVSLAKVNGAQAVFRACLSPEAAKYVQPNQPMSVMRLATGQLLRARPLDKSRCVAWLDALPARPPAAGRQGFLLSRILQPAPSAALPELLQDNPAFPLLLQIAAPPASDAPRLLHQPLDATKFSADQLEPEPTN